MKSWNDQKDGNHRPDRPRRTKFCGLGVQDDENLKQTDSTLAEWLHTSRQTIVRYKQMLFRLGYLKLDRLQKVQKLSVNFFPKDSLFQVKISM